MASGLAASNARLKAMRAFSAAALKLANVLDNEAAPTAAGAAFVSSSGRGRTSGDVAASHAHHDSNPVLVMPACNNITGLRRTLGQLENSGSLDTASAVPAPVSQHIHTPTGTPHTATLHTLLLGHGEAMLARLSDSLRDVEMRLNDLSAHPEK